MKYAFSFLAMLLWVPLPANAAPPLAEAQQSHLGKTGWWVQLGDPDLNDLIEIALNANPDIEQAAARLARADAAAKAVTSSLLPNIGASGSAAAIKQSLTDPQIRPFTDLPGFQRAQERYSAGLTGSWEADLFGAAPRLRSARANTRAALAELAAVRVAVAAETASTWITIRELQSRRRNMELQRKALAEDAAIIARRVSAGTATQLDADRIAGEQADLAAGVSQLDGLLAAEIEKLGVLIADGERARAVSRQRASSSFQFSVPAMDDVQVSIAQRPDVVAAELRLGAADAAVSAAQRLRFPRISLSGLLASIASGPAALFTGASQTAHGSAVINLPLLDSGRIDAQIADARGARRAALANARKVALEAAADVTRSVALLRTKKAEEDARAASVVALSSTRQRISIAIEAGILDRQSILDAERRTLVAEDALVRAKAEAQRALVSVFRSSAQMDWNQ